MNRFIAPLLFIFFSQPGCAVFDHDETESNRAKALTNDCFQTIVETSMYKAIASDQSITNTADIFLIQTRLPYNEWETGSYGKKWLKIADIPVATTFQVTKLISQAWGFKGRYWLVYAKFDDNRLLDQNFLIPSGNYGASGQIWIEPSSADDLNVVKFKDSFVTICD